MIWRMHALKGVFYRFYKNRRKTTSQCELSGDNITVGVLLSQLFTFSCESYQIVCHRENVVVSKFFMKFKISFYL